MDEILVARRIRGPLKAGRPDVDLRALRVRQVGHKVARPIFNPRQESAGEMFELMVRQAAAPFDNAPP